jgi:hypothetical protein
MICRRRTVVSVSCYAGYRGEQEPRKFILGKEMRNVVSIVDRWLDPRHRYFKVRADDGRDYLLRHDERTSVWVCEPAG